MMVKPAQSQRLPLDDLIEDFLDDERSDGKADTTLRNYRADLAGLVRQAGELISGNAFASLVRRHLDSLEIAERSWNRHLSTLKRFCDYLVEQGRLAANPLAAHSGVKVEAEPPKVVDPKEVRKLFQRIDRPRDRALIMLLWQNGLRVGEALNLKVDDVELRSGTLRIHDDSGSRKIHLSDAAREALEEYLDTRQSDETDFVFVANGGRALSYAGAHRLFRQYAGDLDITMQQLRAGAAAAAFFAGATLWQVQDMLGHAHAASTARYHVKIDERTTHQRNPKAKKEKTK
jgi:site-specific recombinase XerD